eukprot:gene4754-6666_t
MTITFDTEPNFVERLLILLNECNISRPDMTVVYRIANSSNILQYACVSTDNATYLEYKALPATFTCEFVENALELNLNGPSLEESKPFILSATDKDGRQLMVKLLRMDSNVVISKSFKEQDIMMECEACEVGLANQGDFALVKAQVRENETSNGSFIKSIIMPKYLGDWVLGDFGSCKRKGSHSISLQKLKEYFKNYAGTSLGNLLKELTPLSGFELSLGNFNCVLNLSNDNKFMTAILFQLMN